MILNFEICFLVPGSKSNAQFFMLLGVFLQFNAFAGGVDGLTKRPGAGSRSHRMGMNSTAGADHDILAQCVDNILHILRGDAARRHGHSGFQVTHGVNQIADSVHETFMHVDTLATQRKGQHDGVRAA